MHLNFLQIKNRKKFPTRDEDAKSHNSWSEKFLLILSVIVALLVNHYCYINDPQYIYIYIYIYMILNIYIYIYIYICIWSSIYIYIYIYIWSEGEERNIYFHLLEGNIFFFLVRNRYVSVRGRSEISTHFTESINHKVWINNLWFSRDKIYFLVKNIYFHQGKSQNLHQ